MLRNHHFPLREVMDLGQGVDVGVDADAAPAQGVSAAVAMNIGGVVLVVMSIMVEAVAVVVTMGMFLLLPCPTHQYLHLPHCPPHPWSSTAVGALTTLRLYRRPTSPLYGRGRGFPSYHHLQHSPYPRRIGLQRLAPLAPFFLPPLATHSSFLFRAFASTVRHQVHSYSYMSKPRPCLPIIHTHTGVSTSAADQAATVADIVCRALFATPSFTYVGFPMPPLLRRRMSESELLLLLSVGTLVLPTTAANPGTPQHLPRNLRLWRQLPPFHRRLPQSSPPLLRGSSMVVSLVFYPCHHLCLGSPLRKLNFDRLRL